jgi:hypothetical protein
MQVIRRAGPNLRRGTKDMWVDTGQRLVNITSADKVEIVREISDVRAGDRDVWIFSVTATFGERVEHLVSVITYPPRDTQDLGDLNSSGAVAHARKARHTDAATAECLRCLRAISTALKDHAPYCSIEGLYQPSLDPNTVEAV